MSRLRAPTRLLGIALPVCAAGVLLAFVYAQYYPYNYNSAANLLSFVPPQYLNALTPTFMNILGGVPVSQLPILANALSGYSTFPNFLNQLQAQSPALYNAYNQLMLAYSHNYPLLYPGNQALLGNMMNGFGSVLYNGMYGANGLNPLAMANLNRFMPGVSPFLLNPGMQTLVNQYFPPFLHSAAFYRDPGGADRPGYPLAKARMVTPDDENSIDSSSNFESGSNSSSTSSQELPPPDAN